MSAWFCFGDSSWVVVFVFYVGVEMSARISS